MARPKHHDTPDTADIFSRKAAPPDRDAAQAAALKRIEAEEHYRDIDKRLNETPRMTREDWEKYGRELDNRLANARRHSR